MKKLDLSFISGLITFALLILPFGGTITANAASNDQDVRSYTYGVEDDSITDDVYGEDSVTDDVYGEDSITDDVYGDDSVTDDVYGDDSVTEDVYGDDSVTDDVYGDDSVTDDVYGEDSVTDDVYGEDSVTDHAYHLISNEDALDLLKDKDGNIIAENTGNILFFTNILNSLDDDKEVIISQEGVELSIPANVLKGISSDYGSVRVDVSDVSNEDDKYKDALSPVFDFSIYLDINELFKDEFNEPFEITFTVDPKNVKNWGDLVLRYFDDEGNITDYTDQFVSFDEETGEVVVNVNHFSSYGIFEVPSEEPDTPVEGDDESNKDEETAEESQDDNDKKSDEDEKVAVDSDEDDKVAAGDNKEGNKLPATATNLFNFLLTGGVLLIIGIGLFVIRRRDFA